jgi:hypothetical protein
VVFRFGPVIRRWTLVVFGPVIRLRAFGAAVRSPRVTVGTRDVPKFG